MAGKKGSKKSKAKKATKRVAKGPRRPPQGAPIRFAMEACSVSNPFCPEAIGSRWPDNSYTKSSGYSVTATPLDLSTNATGDSSVLFFPTAQYCGATLTGTTGAFGTLFAFSLPSNVVRWRLTSFGLKVQCPLPKMTAQGTVLIRLFSPMSGSTLASMDVTTIRADSVLDIPVSRLVEEDVFVIPMPLGDNARWFNTGTPDANTTTTTWVNPGWQVPLVSVRGAPAATTALRVYAYYNLEFVFADGASESFFTTAPPPDKPSVKAGNSGLLSQIGNFFEGTAEKLDSIFRSKALNLGVRMLGAGATRNPMMLLRDVD